MMKCCTNKLTGESHLQHMYVVGLIFYTITFRFNILQDSVITLRFNILHDSVIKIGGDNDEVLYKQTDWGRGWASN